MYNSIILYISYCYIIPFILSIILLRLLDNYNRRILAPLCMLPILNIFLIFVLLVYYIISIINYITYKYLNIKDYE